MSTTQTLTNGDVQSSHFVNHLASYPVVSDGINTFKSNPYGAKSIDLADATYARFGKPIVPYLRTPYSYAAPYLNKADDLADKSLGTVETHFPLIKQDTSTVWDATVSLALWPFTLAGKGKDYVLGTYGDEYNKTANSSKRGAGLTTVVLAVISTELKITSDALQVVADYLGPKKEQAKSQTSDLVGQAKQKKDAYASKAQEKAN